MRQLRDDTHLILDGEVRVYRRERLYRQATPHKLAQGPSHPPAHIAACARARDTSGMLEQVICQKLNT